MIKLLAYSCLEDYLAMLHVFLYNIFKTIANHKSTAARGCVPLGLSGSGSVIQDHWDHGASKKPMNPLWSRIHQFLWWTMTRVTLDHWSWSRSPKRKASKKIKTQFLRINTTDKTKIANGGKQARIEVNTKWHNADFRIQTAKSKMYSVFFFISLLLKRGNFEQLST